MLSGSGCSNILDCSGLQVDVKSGNMGGPSCDPGFGEAGLDNPGKGEVGLDEVKLKKDMVMLLLSVFFLGLVGAGLTASAFCIGKLIFLWLSG